MTIVEASEHYHIPVEILREYEEWGLCKAIKKVMGLWQYDDNDLEQLGMIMTLHDTGFSNEEVKIYMRLLLQGEKTEKERLRMLNVRRSSNLDEIHFKEKQIDRLDYLRHRIQRSQTKK